MSAASIIAIVSITGFVWLVVDQIIHAVRTSNQGPWWWCCGCGCYWNERGMRVDPRPENAGFVVDKSCPACRKAGRVAK